MIDSFVRDKFLKNGRKVEQLFLDTLNHESSRKASDAEDIYEHWDVEFTFKIDVKGIKKIRREDSELNPNYHWIEIKGVRDDGWLYGGKSDYIAFEVQDYFIVVSTEKLKQFIKEKCKDKVWTTERGKVYKLYRRKDRSNEILTLVPTADLFYLSSIIVNKNN